MKTYTQGELQEILRKHKLWLDSEEGGEKANLRWANLGGVNLGGADLRWADLREARLYVADLCEADLRGADLSGAVTSTPIITFNGPRHTAIYCQGYVRIGCKHMPLADWLAQYAEVGGEAGYTEEEIATYGEWLESLKFITRK